MQVEFVSGDWQTVLVAGGALKCAYRSASGQVHKASVGEEGKFPSQPIKQVSFFSMPVASLRLLKIYFEHSSPAETLKIQAERLPTLIAQWARNSSPNLAVLRWSEADGLFIIFAGNASPVESAFFSKEGQSFGADALAKFHAWKEATLDATRYAYAEEIQTWAEYSAHVAFVALLEQILLHYKELTGLALLNALGRNINRVAMEHKCDVSVVLGKITDQALFSNLEDALWAYNAILSVAFDHVAIVLGQKLMQQTVHDSLGGLDPRLSRMARKFDAVARFVMAEPGRVRERIDA
ncbi:MAG: hypothetical protein AB1750_14945 [Chloroflexota bacterium]